MIRALDLAAVLTGGYANAQNLRSRAT